MMDAKDKHFLINLLKTPSPTGREQPGQHIWGGHIKQFSDSLENDAYGNTWARLKGTGDDGPTVMLEAHADEIGFMINHVTDEGFLHVFPVGGSDVSITRGKRVKLLGGKGEVFGVIGNNAIHLRRDRGNEEKAPKWHEVFIDVGAQSAEEVAELGLRVGHYAVYDTQPREVPPHRLVSRAIDNRVGGYILARVIEELSREDARIPAEVLAVNAVQEEIGGYGARMVSYRLFPDLALVFDVTHATDSPGIDHKQHGKINLGDGPALTHGTANHPLIVDRLIAVAEREKIPLQHEASSRTTGTDTDDIYVSRSGVPAALISVPLRYMHSPVEMIDFRDVEATISLVCAFLRDLEPGERFQHPLPV
jgi:endoglucanase